MQGDGGMHEKEETRRALIAETVMVAVKPEVEQHNGR